MSTIFLNFSGLGRLFRAFYIYLVYYYFTRGVYVRRRDAMPVSAYVRARRVDKT